MEATDPRIEPTRLMERRGEDEFHLWAGLDRRGWLHIEWQDMSPMTAPISADGEYEYFITIAAGDIPHLVARLNGARGEPVLDLPE
jgi:hypothetical protein